jgi:predicted TIM-barrel fold metal-dependent hydrolase
MDRESIWAQVLYPNVGGFGAGLWLSMEEQALALACVRAYNDFQTDFCSADPRRLLAVTSIPFWNLEASLAEVERCLANGHVGVNFCNQPDVHGEPPLFDRHWDPLWSLVQEAGVPVNCHIGGGDITGVKNRRGLSFRANFARASALMMMNNMQSMGDLLFGGVCHRFPGINFVSVESGIGFLPSLLETFDWQWRNGGVADEHPEWDLLPSEYFRRQVYCTFWFERESAVFGIEHFEDNIMFETDFPHPTCQHPGPQTPAMHPHAYIDEAFGSLSDATLRKLLSENAARVYNLELPVL